LYLPVRSSERVSSNPVCIDEIRHPESSRSGSIRGISETFPRWKVETPDIGRSRELRTAFGRQAFSLTATSYYLADVPREDMSRPTVAKNGKPVTTEQLLRWKRGPLWDYVCVISGLKNIDLISSHHAIGRNPRPYQRDVTYNLVNGTEVRAAVRLKRTDPGMKEEAGKLLRELGIKEAGTHKVPPYYRRLTDFAWHNSAVQGGAHFTPIYYSMEQGALQDPGDRPMLETMRRRLVYLEILGSELESLEDVYDFETIRIMKDWTACLVESFASRSAEVALLMTEYKMQKGGERARLRFEDLLRELSRTHRVFSSINSALEGFLLVSLRNLVVHTTAFLVRLADGHPQVHVSLGERESPQRFGVLLDYVKDEVATLQSSVLVGHEKRNGHQFDLLRDSRFPYVTFVLGRTKKGTRSTHDAELRYDLSLGEFVKIESSFLFLVGRLLFGRDEAR